MAHNISTVSGQAEVVGQRGTLWHGLGTEVDHLMNIDEVCERAGFLYAVEPRALKLPDGTFVPDVVANVRISPDGTDVYLGCVSTSYAIMPQQSMKELMADLTTEGYSSGGVLQGGRKSWLSAKMPKEFEVMKGGHVLGQYLLGVNSHDGSTGINIFDTCVNTVCNNTFAAAMGGSGGTIGVKLRHVSGDIKHAMKLVQAGESSTLLGSDGGVLGNDDMMNDRSAGSSARRNAPANSTQGELERRAKEATSILAQASAEFEEVCLASRALALTKASDEQVKDYFRRLYPDVTKRNHVLDRQPTRDALTTYYNIGPGAEAAIGTWWGAFQAVTYHETYGRWEGGKMKPENRFAISELGQGRDRKGSALDLALNLSDLAMFSS